MEIKNLAQLPNSQSTYVISFRQCKVMHAQRETTEMYELSNIEHVMAL